MEGRVDNYLTTRTHSSDVVGEQVRILRSCPNQEDSMRLFKYLGVFVVLSMALVGAQNTLKASSPVGGSLVLLPLLTGVVVTPGIAVTAVQAYGANTGCYIQNDINSTTNIIVDPVNVASHTNPSVTSSSISPGGTFTCPGTSSSPVTVDSTDTNHKFYGVFY